MLNCWKSLTLVVSLSTVSTCVFAGSGVSINGQVLTPKELATLETSIGTRIAPGNYAVNTYTGCWANLSTGASGCPGGTYVGRNGSGEWNGAGDWSHYSNSSGFGVGGSSDGCVYAGDWSNC